MLLQRCYCSRPHFANWISASIVFTSNKPLTLGVSKPAVSKEISSYVSDLTTADIARTIWTAFPRSAWFSLDSSSRYMMAGSTTSSNWPNIQRFPSGFLEDPIHTLPLSFKTNSRLRSSLSKYTVSSVTRKKIKSSNMNKDVFFSSFWTLQPPIFLSVIHFPFLFLTYSFTDPFHLPFLVSLLPPHFLNP